MSALRKEQEQFDEVYDKIVKLYDHAENILRTATHESVGDREAFLAEIEPLVQQIEESANALAEDFSRIIESGEEPTNAMKMRVSSALRKILFSIEEYKNHVSMYEAQEE
jgi:DNA-binding ferritin-like protein